VTLGADLSPFRTALTVKDWGQGSFGQNTLTAEVTNLSDTGQKLDLRLTVASPGENPRATTQKGLTLAAGETVSGSIAYQFFHELTLSAVAPGDRVVAAESRLVDVSALAEFAVFKSYYRDDVKVQYRLNVQDADLPRYGLRLSIHPAWSEEAVATREVADLPERTGEVRLDTTGLERGRYQGPAVRRPARSGGHVPAGDRAARGQHAHRPGKSLLSAGNI